MKLNQLSHENKNLEEKMRFFVDQFNLTNLYLGRLPIYPFDNQLSLLNKIVFQLENNYNKCASYIQSYFRAFFLLKCGVEKKWSILYNSLTKEYNDWHTAFKMNLGQGCSDLLIVVKDLHDELEDNLFEWNLNELKRLITCDHKVKDHIPEISDRTWLMVSHFRLKGHSKESVSRFMERILSKDINEFPFPNEQDFLSQNKSSAGLKKEYIETRDFEKQFLGLKNLFHATKYKSGIFCFAISNCKLADKLNKTFGVSFKEVTFIAAYHQDFKNIRKSLRENDKSNEPEKKYRRYRFHPVFFKRNGLIAKVKISYEDLESGSKKAFEIANSELEYINQYLGQSLHLRTDSYLFLDPDDQTIWNARIKYDDLRVSIRDYHYDDIRDNVFQQLRGVNNSPKETLTRAEILFLKAWGRKDIEAYWIYLETIFDSFEKNAGAIQTKFAQVLMRTLPDVKERLRLEIAHLLNPFGFDYKSQNLTFEEIWYIHEECLKKQNKTFDFSPYARKMSSQMFKMHVSYYRDFESSKNLHAWKMYFKSLLLEIYAYRNALVHSGIVNEYSKLMISESAPLFFSRARWILIHACVDFPSYSMRELVDAVSREATKQP